MKKYSLSQLDLAFKVLPDDHPLRDEISKHIEEKVDQGTNADGSLRPNKAKMDRIQKGRKGSGAPIGSLKEFGGRQYIKTATGWKYHGKGTGAKAQAHAAGSKNHDSEALELTSNALKNALNAQSDVESMSIEDHEREANDTGNNPRLRDLHRYAASAMRQAKPRNRISVREQKDREAYLLSTKAELQKYLTDNSPQVIQDEKAELTETKRVLSDRIAKTSGYHTKASLKRDLKKVDDRLTQLRGQDSQKDKSNVDPYALPNTDMTEDYLNAMVSELRNQYAKLSNKDQYKSDRAGLMTRIRRVENVLKQKQGRSREDIVAELKKAERQLSRTKNFTESAPVRQLLQNLQLELLDYDKGIKDTDAKFAEAASRGSMSSHPTNETMSPQKLKKVLKSALTGVKSSYDRGRNMYDFESVDLNKIQEPLGDPIVDETQYGIRTIRFKDPIVSDATIQVVIKKDGTGYVSHQ